MNDMFVMETDVMIDDDYVLYETDEFDECKHCGCIYEYGVMEACETCGFTVCDDCISFGECYVGIVDEGMLNDGEGDGSNGKKRDEKERGGKE